MDGCGAVQGRGVVMRRVQAGDRGRSGSSTTCPRAIEGAHPGRILCVWNVETPPGSSLMVVAGGLTVRNADRPGGRRMTKKRMPPRRWRAPAVGRNRSDRACNRRLTARVWQSTRQARSDSTRAGAIKPCEANRSNRGLSTSRVEAANRRAAAASSGDPAAPGSAR